MRNKQLSQNKQGLTLAAHILQLVGTIGTIAISYRKQIPNACFVVKSVNVNNFFFRKSSNISSQFLFSIYVP